jgi:hypothetical protein
MLNRPSSKAALLAATPGVLLGLAYGTLYLRHGGYSPAAAVALLLVPAFVAALLSWWLWLFWRALRWDATVRWLAPLGLAVLATFIFLMEQPAIQRASRFRRDSASTRGVVTGTYPKDHNRIGYRYTVGPRTYEGGDMAPGAASSYRVGDSLPIYYLRSEPYVSAARYPSETVRSVSVFAALGALWMVAGAANAYYYFFRRRDKRPTIHLQRAG